MYVFEMGGTEYRINALTAVILIHFIYRKLMLLMFLFKTQKFIISVIMQQGIWQ